MKKGDLKQGKLYKHKQSPIVYQLITYVKDVCLVKELFKRKRGDIYTYLTGFKTHLFEENFFLEAFEDFQIDNKEITITLTDEKEDSNIVQRVGESKETKVAISKQSIH